MSFALHARSIDAALRNAHNVLLISHERPDGDSFGAALALSAYLDRIGKPHAHFAPTPAAICFRFLPNAHRLICSYEKIDLADFDVVITLDCGSIKQTKIHDDLLCLRDEENGKCLINFDHHASNDLFGNLNLVDTTSSSTSEIVYRFCEQANISIDKDMATCLLTGLITDTGNFTNGATTTESLRIASELLSKGAKLDEITRHVMQNKNVAALQVWGSVLSRLEINHELGIAYTIILRSDLLSRNLSDDAIDGITNFLNSLDQVSVVMVLREVDDGMIKGSFRTTKDDIDVNKLAGYLGGGGHKKAAGFSVRGKFVETTEGWKIV